MKINFPRLIGILVAVTVIGAVIWWQFNKKRIVKNEITKAVTNGTDSTYYVRYDSSQINALAGNASFFNVVLQSDSLQKELYSNDISGVPKTIFNVRIERLSIAGADIPSLLQKNKIQANSIEIYKPVITIINTGKEEIVTFTAADSLALFEKITGKFKSIQAKEINVIDAVIAFARGNKSPHTNLQGVNITLQNLKIDSSRNYDNIISYFIKDVVASVKTANVKNEKANRLFLFEGIEYNAPQRSLSVKKILQSTANDNRPLILLSNNRIIGLSTNAFIFNKQIKADSLTTDGGAIEIYRQENKTGGRETIEIDNEFFDEAVVKNIRVGNTTLTLYKRANETEKPLVLKNVRFNAANIDSIYSGTDILKLLGNSQWDLSADGISFTSADKVYNINIGPFKLNKIKKQVLVNDVSILPTLSEAAFVKSLKFQKDLFNINIKNIVLGGADLTALLEKKSILAETLTFQPTIKVFNDRTVKEDTTSKKGKYPQQLIMKMATPVFIKKVTVSNGYISYRERGAVSKEVGDVFFSGVNGTLSNVTNIESFLKQNSMLLVNVKARFLNMSNLTSQWKMPMNTADGAFTITGNVAGFDGKKLNPVIEPLGMGSVKSGIIKSLDFSLNGNDYRAKGEVLMLYNDLKIELLKAKENQIKNKSVTSFVANIFIKDQNPSNGKTRKGDVAFERIMNKLFFNLVWKSIFDGAKKSIK